MADDLQTPNTTPCQTCGHVRGPFTDTYNAWTNGVDPQLDDEAFCQCDFDTGLQTAVELDAIRGLLVDLGLEDKFNADAVWRRFHIRGFTINIFGEDTSDTTDLDRRLEWAEIIREQLRGSTA
jgi:hypothetical protein